MGFLAFALLPPESADAHSRTQFPRFRLLALGYGNGLLEAALRFSLIVRRLLQEEYPLQAIEFGFAPPLSRFVHDRQCFRERCESCLCLPDNTMCFGEEPQKIRA